MNAAVVLRALKPVLRTAVLRTDARRQRCAALWNGALLCGLGTAAAVWPSHATAQIPAAPAGPAAPVSQPATPQRTVPPSADVAGTADDPDLKALAAAANAFEEAFARRDAEAIADQFLEEGEWVDSEGTLFHGRAAILEEWAAYFDAQPPQRVRLEVGEWRRLSPQLIVEEGWSTTEGLEDGVLSVVRYVAIYAQDEAGQWKLASVRSAAPTADETPAGAPLKPLEWLVGDWLEESADLVVRTSVRWSDDQRYLLQEFEVERQNQPAMKGTQRIGWDPARKQIRSWVFDSSGGFSEGIWTPDGPGWIARMSGSRSDGQWTASTYYYEPLGADAFQILSTHRAAGNDPEPDMQVTVVRQPPQANADQVEATPTTTATKAAAGE